MIRIVLAFWVVGAVFAFAVDSAFLLSLAGYALASALFALSINVLLGGLGEVPLGQSLFYGLGAYAAALLMLRSGLSFTLAAALAMAVAAGVAGIIGIITLKLTGAYFSIVSWGLASASVVAALNLDTVTGGPLGLFGFGDMRLGPLDLTDPRMYFIATGLVLGVALLVLQAVRLSPFGRAMRSVRESRHLAQAVGIDAQRLRLKAFVMSAPFAALSGAMTVPYVNIVNPEILSIAHTVDGLLVVLLGGTSSLFGPVVAAIAFTVLPHLLSVDPNVKVLISSALVIALLYFAPGGLRELALRLRSFIRRSRT